MKKSKILIVLMAAVVMLLGSCRSAKNVAGSGGEPRVPQCVTAKMRYNVDVKGQRMQFTGNLKMKKDEVISLQLVVFGLMEAARLELTPDHFLIIDRMNKQYARGAYNDVDILSNNGYNFKSIEKLVWGIMEKPDKSISINVPERNFALGMTMLSSSNDCEWETYTNVSTSYKQVSIEEIVRQIARR